MKFIISFSYTSEYIRFGQIEVEAKNEQEARDIVNKMDMEGSLDEYTGDEEPLGTDLKIESIAKQKNDE